MPWSIGWIAKAKRGYKSWLNSNGAGKGGVGILLASNYARMVIASGTLMNNMVLWIKLEGIEGSNLGIECVYTPNIPS